MCSVFFIFNTPGDSSEGLVMERRHSQAKKCSIIVLANVIVLLQTVSLRTQVSQNVHCACSNHEISIGVHCILCTVLIGHGSDRPLDT